MSLHILTGKYIINNDIREEGRGKNMKKKNINFPFLTNYNFIITSI